MFQKQSIFPEPSRLGTLQVFHIHTGQAITSQTCLLLQLLPYSYIGTYIWV